MPNPPPSELRFWAKVLPVESGCWEWQAGLRNKYGYGGFSFEPKGRWALAHRYAYQLCVGQIPEGMSVLHSCDNRKCVRPEHLRVGTPKDNSDDMMARGRNRNKNTGKTHCKNGHPLTPDNVYLSKGHRQCRTCSIAWSRNKRARAKVTKCA